MSDIINEFLLKHRLAPECVDPVSQAPAMAEDMRAGLAGKSSDMPMIPTYLSNDGVIPRNRWAAIIDAGGTNFRRALVRFTESGCEVAELEKTRMPGRDAPCTWDEFISFTADKMEPLMDRTKVIGFCFSYSADITPDMDGIVHSIDKEVVVTGCEGKHIGACLSAELARRGYPGVKVVILNDTVAVLLGGAAVLDKARFSGFIGQVSGTGTNTCVSVPAESITKLNVLYDRGMIVNAESGMYAGIPGGDFDAELDRNSVFPGFKHFEKLTAGEYLGTLLTLAIKQAAADGIISGGCLDKLAALGKLDGRHLDMWSKDDSLETVCCNEQDEEFIVSTSRAVLRRSARCMCTNLMAMALLTDGGKSADRPVCDIAEGSLVQLCRVYRTELQEQLKICGEKLGHHVELILGQDTTVSGAAAAALLNC